jgi:O-antigen/teichoic acid export membrane protein
LTGKIQQAFRHAGFRKYFFNTGWLMADKVVSLFAGLFVGVYVARYLGPERFGLLSYAVSFVGLFTAFATLGLDSIVVRNLVQNTEDRDRLLGTAFILKLMGGILLFGAVAFAVRFTSSDSYTRLLILIIAGGVIFEPLKVIDFYFQSQVLGRFSSAAGICALCASSFVRIALVFFQASLVWFVAAQAFSTGILALMLLFFYFKHGRSVFKWHFDWGVAKELLTDSWPLIFSGLALMVQARIDQVMLKEMIDVKEVGYYSIALKLIEIFGFIPVVLNQSLLPTIINSKKISELLYQVRLQHYYKLSFLIFLLIAAPIFIFSEKIVIFFFGEAYRSSGVLLSLMAARLFFTNMGVARSAFLLTANLLKYSFVTMLLGTIVNVVINYILIPDYRSTGAIFATILSFFVTTFLIDFFYIKTRHNAFLMVKCIITSYTLMFHFSKGEK